MKEVTAYIPDMDHFQKNGKTRMVHTEEFVLQIREYIEENIA